MDITYLPLVAKEGQSARITINSNQLGVFMYDFKLKATAAGNERPLHFKVGLGDKQTNIFRFVHYSKTKTVFDCRVDNPDFIVEKSISVSTGI